VELPFLFFRNPRNAKRFWAQKSVKLFSGRKESVIAPRKEKIAYNARVG